MRKDSKVKRVVRRVDLDPPMQNAPSAVDEALVAFAGSGERLQKLKKYPHGESNPGFRAENPTTMPGLVEENASFSDRAAPGVAVDAELARIVAAWPTLPEPLKRAMLALIG